MPTELDLEIVNALQIRPRAEWSAVGAALGTTGATVARHWSVLEQSGLAWITTAPGPRFLDGAASALVLLSVAPGQLTDVAERLRDEPAAATVSRIAGGRDFLIDTFADTFAELTETADRVFACLPGVDAMDLLFITAVYRQGSAWRIGSLDSSAARAVAATSPTRDGVMVGRDETDRALLSRLSHDGRTTWAELGEAASVSAQTAKRRVERHLESGYMSLRCDTAPDLIPQHQAVTLTLNVPVQELKPLVSWLGRMSQCRVCAEVIGVPNVLVTFWVPDLADVRDIEAELVARAPNTVVVARHVTLRTIKRLGHVLDPEGRSERVVPIATWGGDLC